MVITETDPEPRATTADRSRRVVLSLAAGATAISAVIHLILVPDHLREWPAAGIFFIVAAAGQGALAVALLRRPGPLVLIASIWSSFAIVVVYVWSRTAGIPFAPAHAAGDHGGGEHADHAVGGHGNGIPQFADLNSGHIEAVGRLDLTALGAELLVIGVLFFLLPLVWQRRTGNAAVAAVLILLAVKVLG